MKDIINILDKNEENKIKDFLKKFKNKKNYELEFSLKNLNYIDFLRISKYYIDIVEQKNIFNNYSLDILINLKNDNIYRISIYEIENIEKIINQINNMNKDKIIDFFLNINSSDNIIIIYKNRGESEKFFLENYDVLLKLTEEKSSKIKPKKEDIVNIYFRYKNRYTFKINKEINIDITEVQKSNDIKKIFSRYSNYEIEMEIINDILYEKLYQEFYNLLSIYQNSEIPINKKEIETIIDDYYKTLELKNDNTLQIRNVISLEIQHIIKFIPNKYAVTDKADGERYILFINNDNFYLISSNLKIKKIHNKIKNNKKKIILDGELINIKNNYIYLIFDLIYFNNINYRENIELNLVERLKILNKIMSEIFNNDIVFNEYIEKNKNLELDKIKIYYENELEVYWKKVNEKLKKSKDILILKKIYLIPYGIESSEVFMYADLLWKNLIYKNLTPYKLDGIIYTPINTPYMIKSSYDNLDDLPLEYKWKPPNQNSIDFYIIFEKDEKGNDIIYYDDGTNNYKFCKLYVGITKNNDEIPIPFKIDGIEQKAKIYLKNDNIYDLEENIINDKTVVEFIYDTNKLDLDQTERWIPLKTRYDKTESVKKYKKKYGNNVKIANRIWRSINNPITEETINNLGKNSSYSNEIENLKKIISDKNINFKNNLYYQKKTFQGVEMRAFNNWLKSNMILTYSKNKNTVLDIGCGRGGDLTKFIHSNIKEYIGIDIDNNGLYNIVDSAYNRYKKLKKKITNMPLVKFINVDVRSLLNLEEQQKTLPSMTQQNKDLIKIFLNKNKKYDIINIQFNIHYYLSDELTWNNFCQNINDYVNDNGYLLITCFDGNIIYDKLKNKNKLTISYTENDGKKNIFFEILKLYNDKDNNEENKKYGYSIDLYNSLISNPGIYNKEYLVFPNFLIKSLKEKCNLNLIETESFFGIYNIYKNYFLNSSQLKNDISYKKYEDIKNFYLSLNKTNFLEQNEILASFKLSMLNRYYIFKKDVNMINLDNSRIININNKLGILMNPFFNNNNIFIDKYLKNEKLSKLYQKIKDKDNSNIYLIKHKIVKNQIGGNNIIRSEHHLLRLKKHNNNNIIIFYKSPDKIYYPLYYLYYKYEDIENPEILNKKINKKYIFKSEKIKNDLNNLIILKKNK